jgi:hypothetical protein
MKPLEVKLDDWLVKKAPFQLPENARKGLVAALPWLTLVGGALMLWAAWGLYQLLTYVSPFVGLANEINAAYGIAYTPAVSFGPLVWLSLALLVVEAIMFFVAFPALQARKKSGWNLLFWVTLLNVAEVVLQMIGYVNFGSLLVSLLFSVVGLYLLFQVRSYYTGAAPVAAGVGTMKPPVETPPAADKPQTPPPTDQKPEDKV